MISTKKMMSRIMTTRPRMPPPVPYCQAFPPVVVASIGAARLRDAKQSWVRKVKRTVWIILAVVTILPGWGIVLVWLLGLLFWMLRSTAHDDVLFLEEKQKVNGKRILIT